MRLFSASSFVQFLIKICFIPVQLTEDRIVFKFVSWRTLVHLLVYYGWTFYGSIIITPASVITDLFAKLSTVEIVNEILWFICYLVGKTTPLFLANGLKNFEPKTLMNKKLFLQQGHVSCAEKGTFFLIFYRMHFCKVNNVCVPTLFDLQNESRPDTFSFMKDSAR